MFKQRGKEMENYYLLFLGMLVFLLHIPGLIIPKRYRDLGHNFVQQSLNMRLIGLIMVLIGVGAFLVSPSQGGIKWFIMVIGLYQSLSGFALILFPNAFAAKTDRMFSGSIKLWVGRAIAKCTIGLALVAWGAMNIIK
ncbi:hypothetical protein IH785_14075 [candidate division KSB1 bacterium]|nr:hypothetical protein [candidate division KSB1 bacterium]